jgi:Lar family restriction alleviation protein
MIAELKPCPFCGGEARLIRSVGYDQNPAFFVECTGFDANFDHVFYTLLLPSEDEAIERWNKRAGEQPSPMVEVICRDYDEEGNERTEPYTRWIELRCPSCKQDVYRHDNFCRHCGQALTDAV